jgi:hypothetical protein
MSGIRTNPRKHRGIVFFKDSLGNEKKVVLADLNHDQVTELKRTLELDCHQIQATFDEEGSDKRIQQEHALKFRRRMINVIDHELSIRKKVSQVNDVHFHFFNIVKDHVDRDDFNFWLKLAKEKMQEERRKLNE